MTGMAGKGGAGASRNGGGTDQKQPCGWRVKTAEYWCKRLKRVKDGETQYLVCYKRETPGTAPHNPSVSAIFSQPPRYMRFTKLPIFSYSGGGINVQQGAYFRKVKELGR